MEIRQQFESLVYEAIDRVNEVVSYENAVPKEPDTILLGPDAVLDSMGFVNFIVALEEVLTEATGLNLNLVQDLNAPDNCMPTQSTVSDFVEQLLRIVKGKS